MRHLQIINIDCDNTLTHETCFTPAECLNATPKLDIIEKVAELYHHNYLVIYTARRDELIPATLEWLRRNNVRWHAFSNQKPPADVYFDDKGWNINDIDKLLASE